MPLVAQAVDVPMREYPGGDVGDGMPVPVVGCVVFPTTGLAEWSVGFVLVLRRIEHTVQAAHVTTARGHAEVGAMDLEGGVRGCDCPVLANGVWVVPHDHE